MSAASTSRGRLSTPSMNARTSMCDKERLTIGAIGGLLAGIAVYPIPGYQSIIYADEGYTLLVGLIVRLIGFAALGGLWAYLNANEHDRKNVFQFGLVGPAIISAFLTANTPKVEMAPIAEPFAWTITFVSPSYAQSSNSSTESSSNSTTSAVPKEELSLSRKIWQGFTGQTIVRAPQQTRTNIENDR